MATCIRWTLLIVLTVVSPVLLAQADNELSVCSAEYSYEECVERGYFNHWGNGTGGGGGSGGYCQNVTRSVSTTYVLCGDGTQQPCPSNDCYNAPNSRKWCEAPVTAGCCSDGTHEGQDVVQNSCT